MGASPRFLVLAVICSLVVVITSVDVLAGSIIFHNGETFFPIGIYHYPENLPLQPRFEELANAGFNTVLSPLSTPLGLMDAARNHGIGVIPTLGGYMILSSDEDPKMDVLKQHIERLKNHTALLGYEAPDEIAWGDYNRGHQGQNREGLLRGYEYIKSLDPDHPIWMNHAPVNTIEYLKSYSEAGDILGTDIYPVPPERTTNWVQNLNCVGQCTEKLDQIGEGKPIYMVLQGAGWEEVLGYTEGKGSGPQPNWLETRFMTYDAVCHGANGIIYWGMCFSKVEDELWSHLKQMASELRSLTPVLLDGSFEPVAPLDPSLEEHAKVHDGWHYLIVLNTKAEILGEREIQLPSMWNGDLARVLFENRSLAVTEDRLSDFFLPYDIPVYTDDPRADITLKANNPELLEKDRPTNLSVTLWNMGRTPAPSFNLTLTSEGMEFTRALVEGLGPLSSCNVDLLWTPMDYGNLSLRVEVDHEHNVDELTHTDNVEFHTVLSADSQPDLRVVRLSILDQSVLSADILNAGLSSTGSFQASCKVGEIDLPVLNITTLLPGEFTAVSWSLPENMSGAIPCEITADYADEVNEMLEGNNKAQGTVYALCEEQYIEVGGATYPRDLVEDRLWIIRYDPSKATIPSDSDTCTLVWGTNGWRSPYNSPRNSRRTDGITESIMWRGLDGLWYVIIPYQQARTLNFKFRDIMEWGTNWDDNDGKGWTTIHVANLVQSGPAFYPSDLAENAVWIIKYDPTKGTGTIPSNTDACTLVWTMDGGYPPLRPPDSHNINGSCESIMEKGPDGLWHVTIPYQQARTLNFKFRDIMEWGTNWDDNDGKGWRTASSRYVYGLLITLDQVIGNGTKYGANMSAYATKQTKAWSNYLGGNYSQVLDDIDDSIKTAGIEYVRQLLKVTSAQLEELRTLGIDVSQDEELLQRAEAMIEKGTYEAAELYCKTVLQHISEQEASIPEALDLPILFCAVILFIPLTRKVTDKTTER